MTLVHDLCVGFDVFLLVRWNRSYVLASFALLTQRAQPQ
jgi:hypothetical protein